MSTRRGTTSSIFSTATDAPTCRYSPLLASVASRTRFASFAYLRLTLVPLGILSVPLTLLVAHLDPFFGYSGVTPGAAALKVEHQGTGRTAEGPVFSLEPRDGIEVEAGPVRLVGRTETLWRITPAMTGEHSITFAAMRRPSRRRCQASGGIGRRSPARVAPGILQQLRYPSEPRLDRDEISAVTFTYPEAAVDAFGIAMHWTVVYFAFTMAWAIPFARVLRVSL